MHAHEYFHISHSVSLYTVNTTLSDVQWVKCEAQLTSPTTCDCVISLKTDTYLNYVNIFNSFVMENTLRGHRKNQLISGLHGNNPVFIVLYETYKLSGQLEG